MVEPALYVYSLNFSLIAMAQISIAAIEYDSPTNDIYIHFIDLAWQSS